MSQAVATPYVPLEVYFEREITSETKHEWSDGAVYAMGGGAPEHARLSMCAGIALRGALPSDCRPYSSDLMVYIRRAKLTTYADAVVVCGPLETIEVRSKDGRVLGHAATNPTILIEVLSPSSERYDRDGKFQAYKQIESLEEYILVSQDEPRIEIFRRADDWRGEVKERGERVTVHGVEIAVDAFFG